MRRSILFLLFASLTSIPGVCVNAQEKLAVHEATLQVRTTNKVVAPGAAMEFQVFFPDGIPENSSEAVFVFLQNNKSVTTRITGGAGEQDTGFQTFNVAVPAGLTPGRCRVLVQLNELKCPPIDLEITGLFPAPIITSEYAQVTSVPQHPPRPAQAGDIAGIEGSNLSQSDEVEIVDSLGVVHRVPVGSTSSAGSTCFQVPDNVADGDATFEIVEQRSGSQQRSRKVPIRILNVPLPLEIRLDDTRPVAPGQWLEIGFESAPPYDQPKLVEVAFEQNGRTQIIGVQLEPNDDLHVQVPQTFLPGDTVLRTRTLRNGRVSEWSGPAHLQLLEQPAPPLVESVQRMRRKGDQSERLLHLEGNRLPALVVAPGERIAVRGHFAVESTASLQVKLVKGEKTVIIKPADDDRPYSTYFEIVLPSNLRAGDWQIYITEEVQNTISKLDLKLRVQ